MPMPYPTVCRHFCRQKMKKLQLFVDKQLLLSETQKIRRQTRLQYELKEMPTSTHLSVWEYTHIEDGCTTAKA
jgi:hypothetical protein